MPSGVVAHSGTDPRLVVEERFAVVPEWLLDAPISDCAVRLYAVLLRYGQVSGARMPSRSTLARRLHKRSTDTVDRAMRELDELGAVTVTARWAGRERLTNAYRVRTTNPTQSRAGSDIDELPRGGGGGRIDAAPPGDAATTDSAAEGADRGTGGRTDRTRVAARMRHNPEFLTERKTPPQRLPSLSDRAPGLRGIAETCGISNWSEFGEACRRARRTLGQPVGRWSNPCLGAALQLAVIAREWPAVAAPSALLAVAADPATRSPMRVAEAGPWWDGQASQSTATASREQVEAAESVLAEAGGIRVIVQREARVQLRAEGVPVSRASVALRARDLLLARSPHVGAPSVDAAQPDSERLPSDRTPRDVRSLGAIDDACIEEV